MAEFVLMHSVKFPAARLAPQMRVKRGILATIGEADFLEFLTGYVEAMFFTNGDDPENEEDKLNQRGWSGILQTDQWRIIEECAAFLNQRPRNVPLHWLIRGEPGGFAQAGRDFWFTRNGHGTGFWDRDDDVWTEPVRGAFDTLARAAGQRSLWIPPRGRAVYSHG